MADSEDILLNVSTPDEKPEQPEQNKPEQKNFELMHANNTVIAVDLKENALVVNDKNQLPFALSNKKLEIPDVLRWVRKRVDNRKSYLLQLSILRQVYKSQDLMIKDSSAVSVIDNFWIRRSDTLGSWDEILKVKDINQDLINVILDKNISDEAREKIALNTERDVTSAFTLKGMFPKAPYKNTLLKKGYNAEYEIAGYIIGKTLGIETAEAKALGGGTVECVLFTSPEKSMCHIADILHFTNYEPRDFFTRVDYVSENENIYKAVYDFFARANAPHIAKGLERLFILAYVTINIDLHEENFGIMYSPSNFDMLCAAPAYDFNNAFTPWDDAANIKAYDPWIIENLPLFIKNNPDIKENIPAAVYELGKLDFLPEQSKKCVADRLNYVLSL
jgi:hypothetical protein